VAGHSIRARPPRGAAPARIIHDQDILASHLADASHFHGGHSTALIGASSEAEVAAAVRCATAILPIGAQSSLTGGATPMGETVLSTSRLNRIEEIGGDRVRVQAGATLAGLDTALAAAGRYYPPAPTFTGAFVGGTVATNAAGAATFKYGTTRDWVLALTVVLPNGDVLDVERGSTCAREDGTLEIILSDRTAVLTVPGYRVPQVPKSSAGYFAAPRMDLVDLFIGSEGTLGVITEVTLRVVPSRPAQCLAFVPFADSAAALTFVRRLRECARETWRTEDPGGLNISAIEHMDARCLALLREDHVDHVQGVPIPQAATIALLVTVELPPGATAAQAYEQIGAARDAGPAATPLARFCRMLDAAGVLEDVQIALPGDSVRSAQLMALREAVPATVNARIGRARETIDSRIAKTAADMIVPFDRLAALMVFYDDEFRRRGLDAATWGHISDGNLHPNVIPRSFADVASGEEAILAFGREVIRLGGSPLAEHGVGRHPVKQQLLEEMYGQEGIEEMRRIKHAIDPEWKMAPGVIFQRGRSAGGI
jgi:D-lactate dehydrogenase (cytochrome)